MAQEKQQLDQLSGYGDTLAERFASIEHSSRLEGFEPTARMRAVREAVLSGEITPQEATQAVLLAHQTIAAKRAAEEKAALKVRVSAMK